MTLNIKNLLLSAAAFEGRLDGRWSVASQIYRDSSKEPVQESITASYNDDVGNRSLLFQLMKSGNSRRHLETDFFAGRVQGHDVIVMDVMPDAAMMPNVLNEPQRDGVLSHADQLIIDGAEYMLSFDEEHDGKGGALPIFTLVSTGPVWTPAGGKPLLTPFAGMRIKRGEDGRWHLHSSQNRSPSSGAELTNLLNSVEILYGRALDTASRHIR